MTSPSDLHLQAANLREQGSSLESLALYEQALISYLSAEQTEYLVNVLLEKNIVLKHLWHQNRRFEYLELAKQNLTLGFTWQKRFGGTNEQQALLLFGEAEIALLEQNLAKAISAYEQALDLIPADQPFHGQIQYHLGFAQVMNEKIEIGFQNLERGKSVIELAESIDPNTKIVWVSGAWLRLAQAYLKISQEQKAEESLKQAEKIILSNPSLKIRRQDLDRTKQILQKRSFSLEEVL